MGTTAERDALKRDNAVSIYLSEWEAEAVSRAAARAGVRRAEWLRMVALRAARDLLAEESSDVR